MYWAKAFSGFPSQMTAEAPDTGPPWGFWPPDTRRFRIFERTNHIPKQIIKNSRNAYIFKREIIFSKQIINVVWKNFSNGKLIFSKQMVNFLWKYDFRTKNVMFEAND